MKRLAISLVLFSLTLPSTHIILGDNSDSCTMTCSAAVTSDNKTDKDKAREKKEKEKQKQREKQEKEKAKEKEKKEKQQAKEREKREKERAKQKEKQEKEKAQRAKEKAKAEEKRLKKAEKEEQKKAEKENKRLANAKKSHEDLQKKNQKPAGEKPQIIEYEPTASTSSVKKEDENNSGNSKYASARGRKPRNGAKNKSKSSGNSAFESAKGDLPYPVEGPFKIVSHFGLQNFANRTTAQYDNPGIDAEVNENAPVMAVYDGTVSGVYKLDGFNNVIIVSHNGYYTVYGNLGIVNVTSGQAVKQGDTLGKAGKNNDKGKGGLLHFEVWQNRQKLNPENWLQ